MTQKALEQYREREKRINEAIQLKVPDRVPFWFQDISFFPAKYAGTTCQALMFDDDIFISAYKKTLTAYSPDMYFNPGHALHTPGQAINILGSTQVKLPGRELSPDHTFQYLEGEYMKAEEYDVFLNDPTDFAIRAYIPRVLTAMAPLAGLPPLTGFLMGYFGLPMSAAFSDPDITAAFTSFYQAVQALSKHNLAVSSLVQEMKELGYPLACGGITLSPFDVLSDTLRGMKGLMLDMYRRPDKILASIEKLLPMLIGSGVSLAKASGTMRVFIPLHRGADGFMSLKQFETFYWPGLKRLMLALIDEGITPCPFFEGDYTSRLEHLTELPEGKVLGLFDATDPLKAKEILGKTMCISGMMPLSLLQVGSPDQIKEYTKKLIDTVGKDGGFIMGPRSAMDECDPDRVRIWVNYTREYGVYK